MKRETLERIRNNYDAKTFFSADGKPCGIFVESPKHIAEFDLYEDGAAKDKDRSVFVEVEEAGNKVVYRFYAPEEWFDEGGCIIEKNAAPPILRARLESGLSQAEAARRTKIPIRTLQKWESGSGSTSGWMERLVIKDIKRVSGPDWNDADEDDIAFDESGDPPILQARHEGGLSRAEIAERTGISSSTIQGWESGERSPSEWMQCLIIKEFRRVSEPGWAPDPDDEY